METSRHVYSRSTFACVGTPLDESRFIYIYQTPDLYMMTWMKQTDPPEAQKNLSLNLASTRTHLLYKHLYAHIYLRILLKALLQWLPSFVYFEILLWQLIIVQGCVYAEDLSIENSWPRVCCAWFHEVTQTKSRRTSTKNSRLTGQKKCSL